MIRLAIGIVIGALAYYYFPAEVETAVSKMGSMVHEGAARAAEATKPESDFEKLIEKVTK